jgi:ABC-2 type transport system ATP-binding protein
MTLLKVNNLRKRYGKHEAVKGISFQLEEGRCVSLLGPNGAGKTTTLSMLAGLIHPTSGEIYFQGISGTDFRQQIGFLPQYPSFYNWMSGREFIEYVGKLAHIPTGEIRKRSDEVLEFVGISIAKNRKIGSYSGGMRQRLGLAQALIHKPKLLILDEPVSALDPIGRREVLNLIKSINKETTVLFSTHLLHDAEEISDDLLIMHRGEILLSGDMKMVMSEAQQPVIHIKGESSLEKWAEQLKTYGYITKIICNHEHLQIMVTDLEESKSKLLKEIAEKEIPIRKFEVAETTLEDLFMKVVGV